MNGATAQALPATSSAGPFSKASGTHSFSFSADKNSAPGPTVTGSTGTSLIRSVILRGPAGRLEAVLNSGAADAPFAALICPPHPVLGGTLHSKVVYHAMKALNDSSRGLGWPVLRFNFRGAGLSEGTHDGEAEVGDVLAALDWLEKEFNRPIVLAGFSFGASTALRACDMLANQRSKLAGTRSVKALIALGLPVKVDGHAYEYGFLKNLAVPKLFLSGDCDPLASPAQLRQIAESAAEPKQLVLLTGADHFFTGQLETMQKAITDWLTEQFK